MMLSLTRRGVDTDIFKWIFGTIAGAILFIFFIRFGFTHIGISEQLDDRRAVEFFQDHLDAFGTADVSSKTISIADDLTLQFSCGMIGSGTFARPTSSLIFAPPSLSAGSIFAWTQRWNFPFPITNIFYLSSPLHRTVVVYDKSTEDLLLDFGIPDGFPVQFVHRDQFTAEFLTTASRSVDRLIVVMLSTIDGSTLAQLSSSRVFFVVVDTTQHTVSLPQQAESFPYLGPEFLIGTFFAPEDYACLLQQGLDQLHRVALVYSHKAGFLMQKTTDPTCRDLLFTMSTTLASFSQATDGNRLYELFDQLDHQRQDLIRHSCPRVM